MNLIPEKFRHLSIRDNTAAKVVSLLLSIILWAYLSSSRSGEIKFKIPIVIKNLPSDMIIMDISKKSVIVVFEGRKEYLKNLNVKNLKTYIDLSNPSVGKTKEYQIELVKNEIPISIKVRFLKENVNVLVEKKISRKVRVIVHIVGQDRKGIIIGKYSVVPEYITITGSKSVISKIDKVSTEDISIEGKVDNIDLEVLIKKKPDKKISYSNKTVKVYIPVINYNTEVSIPVILININEKYEYLLKNNNVKVYLKIEGESNISPGDFLATVNVGSQKLYTGFTKNKNELKMKLPLKVKLVKFTEGVDIVTIKPENVQLVVTKK